MDIYTAVKKEKKHFKTFLVTMFIISIILPVALILTGLTNAFYIGYLIFVEFLIVIAVIIRFNSYSVEYRCMNNKLIFKTGIFTREYLIICDRVVLVHTNKSDYDLEIVIITNVAFKNKALRKVESDFLKRYPQVNKEFKRIKQLNPEKNYYFQLIRIGGLKKYLLLDCIYKNCVKAIYTDDSIQNIKIARGQTIV
ncbi:hypothetical protein [Clostridium saccharobutylicum]|uniref:Transmembrane protein n=2 Tax=Clostridium saccharobutylicum TaxID=169679 RepID=U5MLQ9_CLOSA|nr:hypothetical protein [Clostridium saccharobutylicum]AGX41525.1 hypothetical protein CLSA_c05020 [Clostridium saccharobutylicum DSM 13864]AQR88805.1 hypothetical protein CLOSC_04900 [Clostridium saccharobutylicum]AQR98704.1 hypothetical protein CSACC_04970 [Clostridium saccharobutylicum]AQS08426.1 hypothetical protein CLOBY_05270 [Clostridium saccharobutylicum]AQS12694.1 hypothetical protein CLOSACC_04970 [Clostridium saccharobutylicum]